MTEYTNGRYRMVRAAWTPEACDVLRPAYGEPWFPPEASQGVGDVLWAVDRAGEALGYVVTRVDRPELVMVAGSASADLGIGLRPIWAMVAEHAQALGLSSVRIHTANRKMQRVLELSGLKEAERVYRLEMV